MQVATRGCSRKLEPCQNTCTHSMATSPKLLRKSASSEEQSRAIGTASSKVQPAQHRLDPICQEGEQQARA